LCNNIPIKKHVYKGGRQKVGHGGQPTKVRRKRLSVGRERVGNKNRLVIQSGKWMTQGGKIIRNRRGGVLCHKTGKKLRKGKKSVGELG